MMYPRVLMSTCGPYWLRHAYASWALMPLHVVLCPITITGMTLGTSISHHMQCSSCRWEALQSQHARVLYYCQGTDYLLPPVVSEAEKQAQWHVHKDAPTAFLSILTILFTNISVPIDGPDFAGENDMTLQPLHTCNDHSERTATT
jgi:hypothetical protein